LLDLYAHLDGALDWQRGLDPYHVYLSHRPGEIGGGYVFPPFTLPLALALAHIPRQAAASLWTLAGVAALAWLLWDLAKPRTPTRLAAVTLLAVFFYPLLTNFALGQVGIVALLGAWIAGRLAATLPAVSSSVVPLAVVAGVALSVMGRPDGRLHGALLLACLPLVVPNAWQHYCVFSFPLLWMVVSAGFHRPDP